jgi:YesN/AraC family two-component response regulator
MTVCRKPSLSRASLSTVTADIDAPATVLVVEDDALARPAIAMILEDHGFTVVTAVNGIDGLRKFRENKPDVVLTDIIMPEKEGIGLILDIRRESPDVKIVAMSGSGRMGNSDYVSIAMRLGANASLYKPFDDQQLIQTVCALVEHAPAAPPWAAAA